MKTNETTKLVIYIVSICALTFKIQLRNGSLINFVSNVEMRCGSLNGKLSSIYDWKSFMFPRLSLNFKVKENPRQMMEALHKSAMAGSKRLPRKIRETKISQSNHQTLIHIKKKLIFGGS